MGAPNARPAEAVTAPGPSLDRTPSATKAPSLRMSCHPYHRLQNGNELDAALVDSRAVPGSPALGTCGSACSRGAGGGLAGGTPGSTGSTAPTRIIDSTISELEIILSRRCKGEADPNRKSSRLFPRGDLTPLLLDRQELNAKLAVVRRRRPACASKRSALQPVLGPGRERMA